MTSKKRVLFLCTHNSCRSQMAEGLLKHLAPDKFEAESAGTNPSQVHPLAVKVMEEAGIDISGQYSKPINKFSGQSFDYVITVCDNANQTCPIFPGAARKLHWSFEDPASGEGTPDEKLRFFRRVRDEISSKVKEFINEAA